MQIPQKKLIGILGGICSGKSTAAKEFAARGCALISADDIAHEFLNSSQVRDKLILLFGTTIFDKAGNVIRQKVAKLVFADPEKVSRLNLIIHPLVMQRIEQLIEKHSNDADCPAIVLDIPLLMEIGWEKNCDILVFIACDERERLQRAAKKGDFFKKQLKIRENLQISLDKKADIVHYTVNNNSTLSSMREQVENILFAVVNDG